jgi:uncharacterized membrane protein
MKKFTAADASALVVWLIPIAYLIFIMPSLPASVAMHYGSNGEVDRYGSKSEFLFFQLLMQGVSFLVYLLLKFLPAIDPKKKVKYGESTFQKLGLGLIIFLSALNIAIIFGALHHQFNIEKVIMPITGLLFAFIGNMMNNIKPNYFAGIRTPWTLESEDTWRATHRLASKIWFGGGIVLTILMLLMSPVAGKVVFTFVIAVMVLIPVIYSYVYFKKHQL